ncbi:hypothetical protein AAEX63_10110 [Luteococcus sp. H138]|uniref:hypothetical protein n=1 Tax=unclassified Luteococcus TaxID=2639923 RepID=UPI00313B3112
MLKRRVPGLAAALLLLVGCSGGRGEVTRQPAQVVAADSAGTPTAKLVTALSVVNVSCARSRSTEDGSETRCVGHDDASVHEIRITAGPDGELVEVQDELLSRVDVPAYDSGRMDTSPWDASRRRVAEAFERATGAGLDVAGLFTGGRPGSHHQAKLGDWSVSTWTNSSVDARFSPTFRAVRESAGQVGKKLADVGPAVALNGQALREVAGKKGWKCSTPENGAACWTPADSTATLSIGVEGDGSSELHAVQVGDVAAWPSDDEALRAALSSDLADKIHDWAASQSGPAALIVIDGTIVVVERYGAQLSMDKGSATRLRVGFRPEVVARTSFS